MSLACVGSTHRVPATLDLPLLTGVCFPHSTTVQAPGWSIGTEPWVSWGSSFQVLQKSADSVGPAFSAFPTKAAQADRRLRRALSLGVVCLLPSAVPASVSTCAGLVCLVSVLGSWSLVVTLPPMSTIQNLRKSLVRNWKHVYSLVGDALSGAEFAPFSSPLPPASGRGWAGVTPASSSLNFLSLSYVLWTGQQCVQLALFAS